MKNHCEICNHNQLQQRQQNIGAVARNDGRDKTENTEGGEPETVSPESGQEDSK